MEPAEVEMAALEMTVRLLEFVVAVAEGRISDGDARAAARLVLGGVGYWLELEDAG